MNNYVNNNETVQANKSSQKNNVRVFVITFASAMLCIALVAIITYFVTDDSTPQDKSVDTQTVTQAITEKNDDVVTNNNIVSGNHFNVIIEEFVENYNTAFKELYPEDIFGNELLNLGRYTILTPEETGIKGAWQVYMFDQTLYSGQTGMPRQNAKLFVAVDKMGYCMYVSVARQGFSYLNTKAKNHWVDKVCFAAYIAATGDTNYDKYIKAYENSEITKGNGYEYAFGNDGVNGGWVTFMLGAGNMISENM